ncbi:MAG: ATP-binding protein [Alphaproteobacteria bacterium]|nr:ATP-binding protein [Alphaproteobacteria bacterium]
MAAKNKVVKKKAKRAVVAIVGRDEAARRRAAAGVAKESGAELYRIDLDKLINKYIGETEKAIDAVLARVEGQNVVLFFDEADALFGKRTDVTDTHDRYANGEIAFLFGFTRATPQVERFADVVIRAKAPPKRKDD